MILVTVALAYMVSSHACPNCRRLGAIVEIARKLVDTQITRSVTKKGKYWILQSPMRRYWEETVERVVSVEEVRYMCARCNHSWARTRRSKPVVSKSKRELDPREWGFFDDSS